MSRIVGIDLGTTNSEIAVVKDGQPFVIPDEKGSRILPSFVGISPNGELLVGQPAKNQYIIEPENTVKSIKRKMGTDERVKLGDKYYTPQEISSFILRRLKEIAERYLGEKIEKAVITVPAYFTDLQRQATVDAGEIAGLEVVRIINEPTAAALVYSMKDRGEDIRYVMVYDLGGGTFDVSIVEMESGVVEVRASHGNTQLGGDDFDRKIIDYVADWFESEYKVDLRKDRKALARLTRAAEKAKIVLSDRPFANISEEFIASKDGQPLNLVFEIARSDFEDLIRDLVESTIDSIDKAIQDAGLKHNEIDKVIMVGGSTRIPLVWEIVHHRLGLEPHTEVSPELCVAMGAAIQAAIIEGQDIDAVLVDVAPHSLGVEVLGYRLGMPVPDQFSVIIRRNTTIPTSKSEVYTTVYDNQDVVKIKVYQGESERASENTLLGEFLFKGIPPAPAGVPKIVITFDYDVNGIVHVTAREKDSGKEMKVTLKATPERMSSEEKEEAKGKTERIWRATVEMDDKERKALISRARKMAKEIGDKKKASQLINLASKLERAIERGHEDEVEEVEDKLLELMYEVETE